MGTEIGKRLLGVSTMGAISEGFITYFAGIGLKSSALIGIMIWVIFLLMSVFTIEIIDTSNT